ncbi:MAG: hypothetical protein PHI68_08015 [Candidatus Cloacimonetes bacterium]|nr:hypothetical protein [Candidatus Cloacimonadota bacterium]
MQDRHVNTLCGKVGLGKKYELDLESITKTAIYEQDLPCISVKRAVEDGLLPEVLGYERFTAQM